MAKALTLGNGKILVNLDEFGLVRDFYFPRVGLENHVAGHFVHRVGVWVDGRLSYLNDGSWRIEVDCEANVLAGRTSALNAELQLALHFTDIVYNEKNIFVRKLTVTNLAAVKRNIRVFFGQQFEIAESHAAHTAYYDPIHHVIIHYRNQRAFLIGAQLEGKMFDDYSTGVFAAEGKEGTHRDAEDGLLAKNNIEHGQADSVIGLSADYASEETKIIYYWLAAAHSPREAIGLHNYVLGKGPGHLIQTTRNYWKAWVSRRSFSFYGLTPAMITLFHKSLFIIRSHADHGGGVIASGDSNVLQMGKDTYAYVWPRDASLSALALAEAGDGLVARSFFQFCNQTISEGGYFMHKYSPDGSLGSSWHPWLRDGRTELPIQEDETALVIHSLWRYYELTKDLEFIEEVYNSLIKKAADFMVLYRDGETGLPKPSYDLWEEKWGVSTFTASAVYGALMAASRFARLLGKLKSEDVYRRAAGEIRTALLESLYDQRRGLFLRFFHARSRAGNEQAVEFDSTVDASAAYGVFAFGVLPPEDGRLRQAWDLSVERLECRSGVGGLARYEGDGYYRSTHVGPGNPWFVPTLWLAQYRLAQAKTEKDLEPVKAAFEWAVKHASLSGIMSEQIHPQNGRPLSVAPLVWSHAEYVRTIIQYLDRLESLGICEACNPVS